MSLCLSVVVNMSCTGSGGVNWDVNMREGVNMTEEGKQKGMNSKN